jgi:NAD(P)-dependent dehydrogenase (short-subunit alcohol dehydrogenase family)
MVTGESEPALREAYVEELIFESIDRKGPCMTVFSRFRLDGKVAVVTGASRGIGEAIARALGDAGARVVVAARKIESCAAVADAITQTGGQAMAASVHMGDPTSIEKLVDDVVARFGGIDVVVNNAATNPVFGPLLDADAGAFQKIFDVNVRGPFLLCKRAQPSMVARGGGSIVHISSIEGISPAMGLALYASSKAALINLSKSMAQEWGGANIRSNVIAPGLVKTKFAQAIWSDDNIREHVVGDQPIARVAEPEEIAGMALFLASPASSYCTGAVYTVDGGNTL